MNEIPLPVTVGTLSDASSGETRQQFANELAARLLVYLPSNQSVFKVGGSQPTSDEGPWFKEVTDPKTGNSGYELWVWSVDAATYKPLTLAQSQLRYFVGELAPDPLAYDLWVQTFSSGAPVTIYTYNTTNAVWDPLCYRISQIDAFFAGEVSGKKQVDWTNVVNKPANVTNAPRAVTGSVFNWAAAGDPPDIRTIPKPNYDWEQIYHTDCGQMLVYDSGSALWKTVDGAVGDLKEVRGSTLGISGDFIGGNFATILGRNPGWDLDIESAGSVVVGAADEVWDSTTTSKKTAFSIYGADETTLTTENLPDDNISIPIKRSNAINGGGAFTNGYMFGDVSTGTNETQTAPRGGDGETFTNVQKSIAYYRIRKVI